MKRKNPQYVIIEGFSDLLSLMLWSCRDSNPGPNGQPGGFLHAYSVIDCRVWYGNRHPCHTVIPIVIHHTPRDKEWENTSIHARSVIRQGLAALPAERLAPAPGAGLKQ